jgi:hypothetical protein
MYEWLLCKDLEEAVVAYLKVLSGYSHTVTIHDIGTWSRFEEGAP